MSDLKVSLQTRRVLFDALVTLREHLNSVTVALQGLEVQVRAPTELAGMSKAVQEVLNELNSQDPEATVQVGWPEQTRSLVRTALALERRAVGERVQLAQRRLVTPQEVKAASKPLEALDALLSHSAFAGTDPRALPRLATYLTAFGRYNATPARALAREEPEPKSRILFSSAMIDQDVNAYRSNCEDRRLPFAIVFVDLDGFKDFNTALGEVHVDRFVLPPILNAIEATTYGHGRAYRHGGDEFLLLLPNAVAAHALGICRRLCHAVSALQLSDLPHAVTLSAGIWITHPESHLTGTELVEAAAFAKKRAKEHGKNRIVVHVEKASQPVESVYETAPVSDQEDR